MLKPNIEKLRACFRENNVHWAKHVELRLLERSITRDDIADTIQNGLCIQNYPDDTPWPSALFFALVNGRPVHVVAALRPDEKLCAIITAYEPSSEYFESDFKTRRKR